MTHTAVPDAADAPTVAAASVVSAGIDGGRAADTVGCRYHAPGTSCAVKEPNSKQQTASCRTVAVPI